jgi:hypothetical protein
MLLGTLLAELVGGQSPDPKERDIAIRTLIERPLIGAANRLVR